MKPNLPTPCPATIASRDEALTFLLGRINYERSHVVPYNQRQLKLDRMRQLLNRLGNPDSGMPIVHVAGTKGKGSTSAFLSAILTAAGYDTGLFSSPHLESIEERFAVNSEAISAEELVMLTERLRTVVLAMDREAVAKSDPTLSPTYFELTTALALLHFAERRVDIAILEVGLGGRLDSTNVCQPVVSVITSISFDHTKQLGNTLPEIAREKAGIIKPGVPVLCGPISTEPMNVIEEVARQHGCRIRRAGKDFQHEYLIPTGRADSPCHGQLEFRSSGGDDQFEISATPLRMRGAHQAANAALAIATAEELRRQDWLISKASIRTGLAQLALPARVEVISQNPTVVLDAAHNVASAHALVDVLKTHFPAEQRTLLLAVSRDKDVAGIVRVLVPHFQHVVLTEYIENPRAVACAELAQIVENEVLAGSDDRANPTIEQEPNPSVAWRKVNARLLPQDLACVTGSFFIAAELRRELLDACR